MDPTLPSLGPAARDNGPWQGLPVVKPPAFPALLPSSMELPDQINSVPGPTGWTPPPPGRGQLEPEGPAPSPCPLPTHLHE